MRFHQISIFICLSFIAVQAVRLMAFPPIKMSLALHRCRVAGSNRPTKTAVSATTSVDDVTS